MHPGHGREHLLRGLEGLSLGRAPQQLGSPLETQVPRQDRGILSTVAQAFRLELCEGGLDHDGCNTAALTPGLARTHGQAGHIALEKATVAPPLAAWRTGQQPAAHVGVDRVYLDPETSSDLGGAEQLASGCG